MPYYCTVPRCTSMAGKAKNVSFHQFPRDEELAQLWNKILKRGKPYTKYSKVCSLHFTPADYTITSVGKNKGQWRTLRKDALPSQNLPSESPTPYQRKQWGAWTHSTPAAVLDPTIQQHVAQAIYLQTMLAMQAAGAAEGAALNHVNGLLQRPTPDIPLAHTPNINERSNSYKCTECSKCFKDPDVYVLHKRTHGKNEKNEKENFSLNVTLQANPILANLLKTNPESSNIYNNNAISVESLLMTALAANMEEYMRNFTSMMKNDDRSLNHDRGVDRDRESIPRGSNIPDRLDLSYRSFLDREDTPQRSSQSYNGGFENGRSDMTDLGPLYNDRGHSNHDTASASNEHGNGDVIRDRIIALYRNSNNVRNIRYYENDENNDRSYENSDGVRNDDRGDRNDDRDDRNDGRGDRNDDRSDRNDDRGDRNDDRGDRNDDRGNINGDRGYSGGVVFTKDDSRNTDGHTCDSDLNESIDSNKLVIDEEIV